MRRLLLGLFFILSFSSFAFASDITFIGGITQAGASYSGTGSNGLSTSAKTNYAYGALFHFMGKGGKVGFSVGGLSVTSDFTLNPSNVEYRLPYLEVPATIDFWLSPYVALGVGGYYAFSAGNATQVSGGVSNSQSFNTFGIENTDYGLLGKLEFHINMGPKWFLDILGAYEYGLSNDNHLPQGTAGQTITSNNILAMGGFGFNFN